MVTRSLQPQWLGIHVASWSQMRDRLHMAPRGLAGSGTHLQRCADVQAAIEYWAAQGRASPAPRHEAEEAGNVEHQARDKSKGKEGSKAEEPAGAA